MTQWCCAPTLIYEWLNRPCIPPADLVAIVARYCGAFIGAFQRRKACSKPVPAPSGSLRSVSAASARIVWHVSLSHHHWQLSFRGWPSLRRRRQDSCILYYAGTRTSTVSVSQSFEASFRWWTLAGRYIVRRGFFGPMLDVFSPPSHYTPTIRYKILIPLVIYGKYISV